jgi:heptose I phosphotransferase
MSVFLREDIATLWQGQDPFTAAKAVKGEVFRNVKGRRTLRFEAQPGSYFIKLHFGVGWIEILKNLLSARMPVISAKQEYKAINRLAALDIPTMTIAAFGERGVSPASKESFLVTDELCNTISLESLCNGWQQDRPEFRFKQRLIEELARISRVLHGNGVCHRDYYLCHFLLRCEDGGNVDQSLPPHLSVIDLHRALIKGSLSERWKTKDIAGLYFSSFAVGLTRTDLCRFIVAYTGLPLRAALLSGGAFWRIVQEKAERVWERDQRKLVRHTPSAHAGR